MYCQITLLRRDFQFLKPTAIHIWNKHAKKIRTNLVVNCSKIDYINQSMQGTSYTFPPAGCLRNGSCHLENGNSDMITHPM